MTVGQTATLGILPTGGTAAYTWSGVWSAVTSYVVNDAITYLNKSYVAAVPNLNDPPPSINWNVNNQGAAITGVPVWSTTNPSIVSVSASIDGLTCVVTAVAAGVATVTVTAQGVISIDSDTIVTVIGANLASILSTTIDVPPA